MGSFATAVDGSSGVTTITVSGTLEEGEITAFFMDQDDGALTNLLLWDFRDARLSDIATESIRRRVRESSQHSKDGRRQAFVFSIDVEFGIGRMIQTFTELEHYKSRMAVFREMNEALDWLLDSKLVERSD